MADSFFSQFFDPKKGKVLGPTTVAKSGPTAAPPPAAKEPPRATPPPAAPVPVQDSSISERLAQLEKQLSAERERALTYEIKFKEMHNAQSAVEEMFEKLWSKANKQRTDEDLRTIREKSLARVETVEARLDEFQKGVLELLKEISVRPTQAKADELLAVEREKIEVVIERKFQDLRARLAPSMESIRSQLSAELARAAGDLETKAQKNANNLTEEFRRQRETLGEMAMRAAKEQIDAYAAEETRRQEVFAERFKALTQGVDERLAAMGHAQETLGQQLLGLEKFCNFLVCDFREMQGVTGALKGSLKGLMEEEGSAIRKEFEAALKKETAALVERIEGTKEQIWSDQEKFREAVITPWEKQLAARWSQVLENIRQDFGRMSLDLVNKSQLKTLGDKLEAVTGSLENFEAALAAQRAGWSKESSALSGKIEESRMQIKTALTNTHHLESTIQMLVELVEKLKKGSR
ncbi:MAG: hypothetical protein AABZ44_00400 [Elusimicrobiota bacterium]